MVLTKTRVGSGDCEESEDVVLAGASSAEAVVGESSSKRVKFGRERWRSVASSAVISCFVALFAAAFLLTRLFDRAMKNLVARMTPKQRKAAFYAALLGIAGFVGYQVL